MSLFKQFQLDESKEREGAIVTFAPNSDGTVPSFRILRRGESNKKYVKSLTHETAPYRRLIQLNALDSKTSDRVFLKVFCSSVLIGWENVQDENDKPIAFSVDNAMALFEKLPELYRELIAQSDKLDLFRQEANEADAKN